MNELINKAADFAAKAHEGQERKYIFTPYFTHVEAVAKAVAGAGGDDAMIAAAYLHDTIEDTGTTYDELVTEFGADVAGLVLELTDVYTPNAYPGLNRKARKELETKRLAAITQRAKLIKLADIADNSATIEARDPAFAKVYLSEKEAILAALNQETTK